MFRVIFCAGLKLRSFINKTEHSITLNIKPLGETSESIKITVGKNGKVDMSQFGFMSIEGPKKGYSIVCKRNCPFKELKLEYLGLVLPVDSICPEYGLLIYKDSKVYKKISASMMQKGFMDIILQADNTVLMSGDVQVKEPDSVI